MTTTLKPIQAQILGTAIIEILSGELSDETVAAIDSLKRDDVPDPLNNLVGMMQGMSTHLPLRQSIISMLQREIASAAREANETLEGKPDEDVWWAMQPFLFEILESNHPNLLPEEIEVLPDRKLAAGWTVPLINHARSTKSKGKELTLELLDVLEDIIKKRRETLKSSS